MAKYIGFGKLARRMLSNEDLPLDVRVARTQFKNAIKSGLPLTEFENAEEGLPEAPIGCTYYEFQVGQAHAGDPRPRGKRRLVALVDAGNNIQAMFFTDAHYTLGEWMQLQYA